MSFSLLKKNKKKEILNYLQNFFGIIPEVFKNYDFYTSGKENLWAVTKNARLVNTGQILINNTGLNFLKKDSRGDYRLTLDGVTVFGKNATKRIIQITKNELDLVIRGIDLEPKLDQEKGYHLLKYEDFIVGCAKNTNTKILIYTPKNRRIKNLDY